MTLAKRFESLARWLAGRPDLLLVAIGVAHRLIVFARFRDVLIAFSTQRSEWLTWQFLPLDIEFHHFWTGLWLLQQTPPLPHLILKAVLALAAWPSGVAQLLCLLQGGISIATACLIRVIVQRATGSVAAAFGLALWFLLSTDVLVLEYSNFGQGFYENLGMLSVAACCAMVPCVQDGGGTAMRRAAALGVVAAFGALSRSSLSYYPLLLVLCGLRRWRLPVLAAYLAPVLLLQGGWALKNAALYGNWAWETSSWGGYSAAKGLRWAGQYQALCDDVAASPPGTYPDWFLRVNSFCAPPFFTLFETAMPADVQAQDAAMLARLGGSPAPKNTVATRMISGEYRHAVERYMLAHPVRFADRFGAAYRLFWQRMADYGVKGFDPLFVMPVDRGLEAVRGRGFGEVQRVMLAQQPNLFLKVAPESRAAWFGTISLEPLDAVSIVVLHLLFPAILAVWLWQRARGREAVLPRGFWVLAASTLYGLVVFNAVDAGENMRFRLTIEPAIIGLVAACLAAVARQTYCAYFKLVSPSLFLKKELLSFGGAR